MIVPFDLDRDRCGRVIVGSETKIACDRAIQLALNDSVHPTIVSMAGFAGPKWDRVWMSQVIKDYISESTDNQVQFKAGKAATFNTTGEMRALAETAVRNEWQNLQIVLAVKWWHAPRSKFLCRYWLRKMGLQAEIRVSSCGSHVGWWIILLEFLYAWPKNIVKLVFQRWI